MLVDLVICLCMLTLDEMILPSDLQSTYMYAEGIMYDAICLTFVYGWVSLHNCG